MSSAVIIKPVKMNFVHPSYQENDFECYLVISNKSKRSLTSICKKNQNLSWKENFFFEFDEINEIIDFELWNYPIDFLEEESFLGRGELVLSNLTNQYKWLQISINATQIGELLVEMEFHLKKNPNKNMNYISMSQSYQNAPMSTEKIRISPPIPNNNNNNYNNMSNNLYNNIPNNMPNNFPNNISAINIPSNFPNNISTNNNIPSNFPNNISVNNIPNNIPNNFHNNNIPNNGSIPSNVHIHSNLHNSKPTNTSSQNFNSAQKYFQAPHPKNAVNFNNNYSPSPYVKRSINESHGMLTPKRDRSPMIKKVLLSNPSSGHSNSFMKNSPQMIKTSGFPGNGSHSKTNPNINLKIKYIKK